MDNKVKGLFFMFFFQLAFFLSSSSLQTKTTVPSDLMQDTKHNKSGNEDPAEYGTALRESIKNEHGFGHGGGSTGSGENRGSTSPNTQGGNNFIPVYAAGSANNRHPNHHGAGNCNRYHIGFSTLVAASIVSLVFFV